MPMDDLSSRSRAEPPQPDPGVPDYPLDEGGQPDEGEESSWNRFAGRSEEDFSESSTPLQTQSSGGAIRDLLEQQLRDRPLPTLAVAVAAGWLVGKLLR